MKLWWAIPLGALIIIPSTRYLLYRDSPGTEDTAITKNLADSQLNNISNSKTPETTNPTPVRPKNVNTDNNSDAADFSVSGYIRNIENMPVSGISVVGSNNNDTPTDGQAGPIKTQSGEDGYYRIEFDRGGIYTITIEPTSEYRGAAIEVSSASDSADITISEIADAVVYGRIIDDNGLPISNALITEGIGRIRTRSDSNGNYRIRIKIPDKRYPRMTYLRSGYKAAWISISQVDFSRQYEAIKDVTLTQSSHTSTVDGWIGSPEGSGIEDQLIRLRNRGLNLYYSAISDANGTFSFEGIREGPNYTLEVDPGRIYEPYLRENVTITANAEPFNIALQTIQLNAVGGIMVDSIGGSVSGLTMTAQSQNNSIYDTRVTSDIDGRFELNEFPVGEIAFRTHTPPFFKVTGTRVSEATGQEIRVPLDIGWHSVSGWVRDQQGVPVENARVILDGVSRVGPVESSSNRVAISDATGYFEFLKIGPGLHHATVYSKGFIRDRSDYIVGSQSNQLNISLSRYGL